MAVKHPFRGRASSLPRGLVAHSNPCAIKRIELEEPLILPVNTTRTQGRVRRIRRGCARWEQDLRWRGFPVKRVAELSLTFDGDDLHAAYGEMRRWLHGFTTRFGKHDLVWTGESQARGMIHFHVLIVNPPSMEQGFKHAWMAGLWGNGFVWVKTRTREQFRRRGTRYLTSYLKDKGEKAYEHQYEHWPRHVRSLGMQRLRWSGEVLDWHRTSWEAVLIPGLGDRHSRGDAVIGLYARWDHYDGDYCPPQLVPHWRPPPIGVPPNSRDAPSLANLPVEGAAPANDPAVCEMPLPRQLGLGLSVPPLAEFRELGRV